MEEMMVSDRHQMLEMPPDAWTMRSSGPISDFPRLPALLKVQKKSRRRKQTLPMIHTCAECCRCCHCRQPGMIPLSEQISLYGHQICTSQSSTCPQIGRSIRAQAVSARNGQARKGRVAAGDCSDAEVHPVVRAVRADDLRHAV